MLKQILREDKVVDYMIMDEESNKWVLLSEVVTNSVMVSKYLDKFSQMYKILSMKIKRDALTQDDIKELEYSMIILNKIIANIK